MPPYMKNGKRDYKTENKKYNSRKDIKKKRASRNKARRKANREGRCRLGDIHHKDNNANNNSSGNTVCKDKSSNRSFPRNKKGGHK